ncbi:formimidoylglutamase [Lentibacillus halophilus]|uniref:Formimidoylglutamase n=1 Tax=Lentibacillus halophilus TaxID=295065 RepID=A0ABN0Z8J1_9BACI
MYTSADSRYWTGRIDDQHHIDAFRMHQVIKLIDVNKLPSFESGFTFIGFKSDEGVKRNKGRTGARKAPNDLRKALASLPFMLDSDTKLIDAGNVACVDDQLEAAQEELGATIPLIYQSGLTPVILGGGHETLYGHYLGARQFIGAEQSLGIINIDAHFDMRDEPFRSSGTMFKQIMENDPNAGYLCLGIQEFGNTKALFNTADYYNCQYILQEDVAANHFNDTFQTIQAFAESYDHVIVTFCTDSIAANAAPGVSAPSPFGLDPKVVRTVLRYSLGQSNVLSFDIAEVNPDVDENGKTVKLAAYLLAYAMKHINTSEKT